MRGKVSIVLMVSFMVVLCSLTTLAQEKEQKAQAYYVMDAAVKPSMTAEYEAAVKEYLPINAEYNATYPWYGFRVDDFHYYFVIPVENLADIDNMFKEDSEIGKKMGEEKTKEIEKLFAGTYEYVDTYMLYPRPDLSYTPENPRLKPEEANYRKWIKYSIQSGKEEEFQEILKKFVSLCKSKNVTDGYNVLAGGLGMEIPAYIVEFSAKNAADQETHYAKIIESLGEEAMSLFQKMFALVREVEIKTAWFRPDLSYMPEEK